ncbi:2TM domain-containing protein [Flavobacterium zhairuonense]|uniref:2TM domain-containing protein n=1 Tax=Flavobacterium zhairuonense TaxID=2493631 RepID=UPI00104439BB|nr:2TM domain-containing protein [Flavobacterium zhairuonense]KAF2509337.1 2TM domain-containing protein [Flavobacterium zhairuonense]
MRTNFTNDPEDYDLQQFAKRKIEKLKSFYSHAFVFFIGWVIYILKEYFGVPFNFLPLKYINGFVMAIWSTAFLINAIDLFASFKIFGAEWEERKVKSILEKGNEKHKWE